MRNFKTVTLAAMGLFIGFVSGCKKGDTGPAGPAGASGAGGNLNATITCAGPYTGGGGGGLQTVGFTNNTGNVVSVTGICADSADGGYALPATTVAAGTAYTSPNFCNNGGTANDALDCYTGNPISCILTAVSPSGTTYVGAATQTIVCGGQVTF